MTIDEDAFLRRLLPRLPDADALLVPPGDDCAAIDWGGPLIVLAAVDQLAAGTHYNARGSRAAPPAELVGRKLLARNLSDVAAMGGQPRYALVAIALQPDCPAAWLERLVDGVLELADAFDVMVVGGDLGKSAADVASLTILGSVPGDEICRRSGAAPGDLLYATGRFGGSLASGRHLRFVPRCREGRWLAGARLARAMIDVSDGLLKDLSRLCAASDVGAVLDEERVPRAELCGRPVSLRQAMLDGEDYELLVAVPAAQQRELISEWPFDTPLTQVGYFTAAPAGGGLVCGADGRDLIAAYGSGFSHFNEQASASGCPRQEHDEL